MTPRHRRLLWVVALVACVVVAGCDTQSTDDPEGSTAALSDTTSQPPSTATVTTEADGVTLAPLEITLPDDYGPVRVRSLATLGDTVALLGVRPSDDGALLVSEDLNTWSDAASWISGFSGSQRVRGIVSHDGRWVAVYNEDPNELAWWTTSGDEGATWQEDTLSEVRDAPNSGVTGVVTTGDRVVATGWFPHEGLTDEVQGVAWHSGDGSDWDASVLAEVAEGSISPRLPFVHDSTVFVPGVDESAGRESSTALLWSSVDGGESFSRQTLPSSDQRSMALHGVVTADTLLVFGWNGTDVIAWRSTDRGETWQAIAARVFADGSNTTFPQAAVVDGECVLLAGGVGDNNEGALWRSCDAGVSWNRVAAGAMSNLEVTRIEDMLRVGDRILLATNSGPEDTVRLIEVRME